MRALLVTAVLATVLFAVFVRSGAIAPTSASASTLTTTSTLAPPVDSGFTFDLDASRTLAVAPVVITGTYAGPPARHVASNAKSFVCGAMYDNLVGGRNSDCVWK
jgi:hypothetical protein